MDILATTQLNNTFIDHKCKMHNIMNFQWFALPAVAQSVNYSEEGSETHCI